MADPIPQPPGERPDAPSPLLPWSDEELASFVTSAGHGRVLLVRPRPQDGDRVEVELRGAGYRVGRLPLTREVSALPTAAATFLPDVVYVALCAPLDPCLAALELLATDPRTGWLPLVALVEPGIDPAAIATAYERSGCDFLPATASDVEILARTHLLVRLSRALAGSGRLGAFGPPDVEVANTPAGDCRFLVDPESGVHTRSYLDHRLPAEIARARRYQRPLSILVAIVESAADDAAVAAEAGSVLVARVRTCDVVGRLSKEAFVVVLPETTVDEAGVLAARVRADFADRGRAVRLGVAGLDEPSHGAHTPAGLVGLALERADGDCTGV